MFGFYFFKKLEVFIPTPTFGSKTKPIYCNFYLFSINANNVLCSITLVADYNVFTKSTSGFGEAGWRVSFFVVVCNYLADVTYKQGLAKTAIQYLFLHVPVYTVKAC